MVSVALVLTVSCQSGAPTAPAPGRVVLTSYDGLGADLLARWQAAGDVLTAPRGLGAAAREGLAARRVTIAEPTLTAPSHVALVTGLPASRHGIVSNAFHLAGTPITATVSGYTTPYAGVALWTRARRAGLRTGVLLWPGTSAGSDKQRGDFGLLWPRAGLARSELLELEPEGADGAVPLVSEDGVPGRHWLHEVVLGEAEPAAIRLELALVDGTADGRPRYDTIMVRQDDGDWLPVGERDWFALDLVARGPDDWRPARYRAWCKVLSLERLRGELRLLRGGVNRLWGYPDDFATRLEAAIGPWPGEPDSGLLADWWLDLAAGIDLDTWLEQAERLDEWLDAAARFALAGEAPRLLLTYHPLADEYQHASLIVDPRQLAWSPGRAIAAREGLARVGRRIDAGVAALRAELDAAADTLALVSDHGQLPIFEQVRVNRLLADADLVTFREGPKGLEVAPTTPLVAVSSGALSHVYLNLAGREPGGVVDPGEAGELLARAARVLADLTVDERPAVERVVTRTDATGLDHSNAGDLIVFFAPGITAADGLAEPASEATTYYGQHGFLASHHEMDGIFLAVGPTLKPLRMKTFHSTEMAPLIASWLELP